MSAEFESFQDNLLEYPQYSRPEIWHDKQVPAILLSGHHANIEKWRREQSVIRTAKNRPDLIERYCTHSTNWNAGLHAFSLNSRLERAGSWKQEITDWIEHEPVDTKRSSEYAANIFNARFGDRTPFRFNGNVINDGSIPNLPKDACVEIPVFAD